MSDPVDESSSEVPETGEPTPLSAEEKRALRWKTIKFVVVFIVSVITLLTSYNFARRTEANDWYLFQVARHTSVLLKQIGYSCTVGGAKRFRGQEAHIRAALQGETPPPPNAPPGPPQDPLTGWEAWQYQALLARRSLAKAEEELAQIKTEPSLTEDVRALKLVGAEMKFHQLKERDAGPIVAFVLRPGPSTRIEEIKEQQFRLREDPSLDEQERTRQHELLEAEKAKLTALLGPPKDNEQPSAPPPRAVKFTFILIPDCGAIPSMSIFFSAILAFPTRWWKRLVGMAVGLPILYWVNAFRLAVLAVIGALDGGGKWFKFAHEFVWQGIYIVFVVALWMVWVEFVARRRA